MENQIDQRLQIVNCINWITNDIIFCLIFSAILYISNIIHQVLFNFNGNATISSIFMLLSLSIVCSTKNKQYWLYYSIINYTYPYYDTFDVNGILYICFISTGFLLLHLNTKLKFIFLIPCCISAFKISSYLIKNLGNEPQIGEEMMSSVYVYSIIIVYLISLDYHHRLITKRMSVITLCYIIYLVFSYIEYLFYVWFFAYFISFRLTKFVLNKFR